MKLYEAFQQKGYHTTVMTTFCVDFDAFESIALGRLRGADCRNVALICDTGMLAEVLGDMGRPPKSAGQSYIVAKARAAAGVFHPKVVVQIGKDRGRLMVMSANATASGMAGNLELAGVIECGAEDSGERRLVLAAWNYVLRFLDARQKAVGDKLRWADDRTSWLDGEEADGAVDLADGTRAAFLATDGETGIAARFLNLIDARRSVERLVVLSPYWDDDLSALKLLRTALRPDRTVLLVDTERAMFPVAALPKGSGIQVSEIQGFAKEHFPEGNKRFVHAKLIMVTVDGMDHVLYGSQNCTFAALGGAGGPGLNEEACLYRRFPAGKLLAALGLARLLNKKSAVDVRHIPPPAPRDDQRPDDLSHNDPGIFELAFDLISWWPASEILARSVAQSRAELELLDARIKPLEIRPELLPKAGPELTFRVRQSGTRPAFARIRRKNGTVTGLAIIACVEDLRTETRDPLTTRAERAIRELERDDDEGIWLLETIQALAMQRIGVPPPAAPRTAGARREKNAPPAAADLDYEAFMRGRRRDIKPTEAERNLLAGSHASFVRLALNRLLGLVDASGSKETSATSEDEVAAALDTGDEVGGAEDALDRGFDPENPKQSAKAAARLEKARRHADAYAIADVVEEFMEEIRQPDRLLDPALDMLRLRAMLMIIAAAGWPGRSVKSYMPTQMQVLPRSDASQEETWPRLMGQLLAAVFSGPNPAIKRLRFEKGQDRLSDDMLETLACCIWCSQAAAAAARADPDCRGISPYLDKLAAALKLMLPLSAQEIATPSFSNVIEGLDQRFGNRLQVPPLKAGCLHSIGSFSVPVHAATR